MKKFVLFLRFLKICCAIMGIGLYIYTITQVWGSDFWTTTLTIISLSIANIYWAYQWWHGFGWNFSSVFLVTVILYILLQAIDKILAMVLEIDAD